MIEEGRIYNSESLAKAIGISQGTFKSHRKKYLQNLAYCCDFEERPKGRGYEYKIKKKQDDYISINDSFKNKQKIREKVHEEIRKNNLQTGTNLGRLLKDQIDLSEGTISKYARDILMEDFGKDVGLGPSHGGLVGYRKNWHWVYLDKALNKYILLTEEQLEYMQNCWDTGEKVKKDAILRLAEKLRAEEINTKEFETETAGLVYSKYLAMRDAMHDRYGFWILSVDEFEFYQKNGYNFSDQPFDF